MPVWLQVGALIYLGSGAYFAMRAYDEVKAIRQEIKNLHERVASLAIEVRDIPDTMRNSEALRQWIALSDRDTP